MAFKVGDKVTNEIFGTGEIVYGPYDGAGGSAYFFKDGDGKHHTVSESLCKPAAKFEVGDRVKTFAATYIVEAGPFFAPAEWYVLKSDRTGNVLHGDADGLSLVNDKSVVINGKTYELGASYKDTDGDVWRFERRPDGAIRGTYFSREIDDYDSTPDEVERDCGPLVRV
jgi:hypothetical protein